LDVYSDRSHRAELRLITCGGAFDTHTGRYVDNVVVFAHLVQVRPHTVRMDLSRHLPRTAAAVLATAVIGSLGTDVRSHWYRSLDKPGWQPPGAAFGPAWTTLYALMSLAAARTLDRTQEPKQRHAFAAAFGTNLALNASWNSLFFKARRPRWALAEIILLEASTNDLTRRAGRADPTAATMLAHYAGWVAFATALNTAIVRRNPGH
jgi:benzodiazapine receptor